jgi:succinoglycan biosynthesis protein ExoL
MMDVLIFAGDLSDAAQQRRILALQSIGHQVHVVGFRKSDDKIASIGEYLDLGRVDDQNLMGRIVKIMRTIPRTHKHIRGIQSIDLIYARNLDMLFFSWFMRLLIWARAPLFYEVLDIHGIFTNGGIKQPIARFLERFLLRRTTRVIVSSPVFISEYFEKIHRFNGDWCLLENKIWQGALTKLRPSLTASHSYKMRIGWVGNIRCQPSFEILMQLADQMDNVEIHIHGKVHKHALRYFDHHVAARDNVIFHGAYEYPDGLADVYGQLDLVWAQDLWQTGANSNWLLPNRIYEAAWHGCPSICIAGTATARKVADLDIGYVIPDANGLKDFLRELDRADTQTKRQDILKLDPALFCMTATEFAQAVSFKPRPRVRLPDFVCIGAMRAGTTTLYEYCAQHPDIGVSRIKETDYFIKSKNLDRGLDWYKGLFPNRTKICGEFSPNYAKAAAFPDVPERMHALIPEAKIIYIVRHPVDRAISQYNHSFLSGRNPPDAAHFLGSHEWEHLIETSSYHRQIEQFLKYYHASQLLVLNFDELVKNPNVTLKQISDFLGVSDAWSTDTAKRVNASVSLASLPKFVFRITEKPVFVTLKSYLPYGVKQWMKRKVETKKIRIPPTFSDTMKMAMWIDMYPDIQQFTKMTGITFSPPTCAQSRPNVPAQGHLKEIVNAPW